jgi:[pyruvate, water dikinase]-phosphate phosphotransferase / [pyruvate, water dikinase] kinase
MSDALPQPPQERDVFFVSDGTGITAETLGVSILNQFDRLAAHSHRMSFVDCEEKAFEAVARINEAAGRHALRPIVFSTLVDPRTNRILRTASALILDVFDTFVVPLEQELGMKSNHTVGRFHTISASTQYKNRIEAINFSLSHDDGQLSAGLPHADVILVGVSRSGKTPTSLYLAMQYGELSADSGGLRARRVAPGAPAAPAVSVRPDHRA